MRTIKWFVLVPLASIAVACGRSRSPAVDDALKNDLSLAAQAQPLNPVSPTEAGYGTQQQLAPRTLQTAARQTSAPVRRTTTTRRSSGTRSSSGGYYPSASADPPVVVEKHTQRDAVIGAAAGAAIGAATSRDKVKGGLIGAVAGGVLGAVVGNNVDVQRKSKW